jgi:hypothetical protein
MSTATATPEVHEDQATSSSETFDDLIEAIVQALNKVGSDIDVSQCGEALVDLPDEDLETIDAWIDDVTAEDVDADTEDREPDWPMVPAVITNLAAPKPAKPMAESREQAVARLNDELCTRLDLLLVAKADHSDAAEESKITRKSLDAAQSALNGANMQLRDALHGDWQSTLPFTSDHGDDGATTDDAAAVTKDPAIEAPVSQLSLTSSVIGKLEEVDIDTIVELEQVISQDRLRKVSGIGAAAIDKISDAVITWRQANGYGSDGE